MTWRAAKRRNEAVIKGDRGRILVNDDHLIIETRDASVKRINFESALSAGSHHLTWMRPVIENFLIEVENPDKRGNNFKEARQCIHCIHAAYQSQRNRGGWIEVARDNLFTAPTSAAR